MTAGRKPTPTALKLLKGTAQPCRVNKNEPTPASDKIRMPSAMSAGAKKCWRIVSKQLTDANVMTNLDVHALSMYCEAYARWQDANKKLEELGPVVKSPSGYPMQSPYLMISNKAFDQMKSMLTEFGMTPSSRTKVSTVDAQQENPLEDFLQRRQR